MIKEKVRNLEEEGGDEQEKDDIDGDKSEGGGVQSKGKPRQCANMPPLADPCMLPCSAFCRCIRSLVPWARPPRHPNPLMGPQRGHRPGLFSDPVPPQHKWGGGLTDHQGGLDGQWGGLAAQMLASQMTTKLFGFDFKKGNMFL